MPVRLDDALSKVLGETNVIFRHDIWLWHTLATFEKDFDSSPFHGINRDHIAQYLEAKPELVTELLQKRILQLVSNRELTWITDDPRLVLWLTKEALNATKYVLDPHCLDLAGRDLPIAILDVWPRDISDKRYIIKKLEQKWLQHKARDKKYAWFKDEDQKCSFAFEWLERNAPLFSCQTGQETYGDLLIFFDGAGYTADREELYIGKIKKAWSQSKYRSSLKGKAQYNFVLSDKAIEALDRLSIQHEISRARIIEILIEIETKKGLYVTEKLKTVRLLQND
ncbi:hypothetical protein ACN429_02425 [Pseudomonas oryzihabitans]|uniref:hypothetical protein n=1 Tax=Pseudomonas oryzihabitans TaxID=47885 RepID=UPI003B221938